MENKSDRVGRRDCSHSQQLLVFLYQPEQYDERLERELQ
jgi:hypothetical protein